MSPWDQQTSDGADKGRTQTPHAGVQPQELEVARTAVHVADRLTSFFSSRRGAAPCHCTLKCTPKEPRGQAYHSVPLTTFTLRQVDDYACHNGEAQLLTDQVRALEPGTPAYAYAKGLLCAYCPVGVVSPFRAQQFMAGNGTRVLRTGRCVRRRGSQRGSRRERKPAGGKGQRQRVEEEIADRIIELLDQGELPPWEKGWSDSQSGVPVNAVTQKAMGYDEPRWLTYRQAEALGGHVRKDEKSTIIIFWKRVAFREREEGEGGENEDHTNNGNDGAPLDVSRICTYPILRSYRVFNLEQTQDCQIKPLPTPEVTDHDPIQDAEAIIAGMPGPPEIEFYENANYVPHYQPAKDVIRVPQNWPIPEPGRLLQHRLPRVDPRHRAPKASGTLQPGRQRQRAPRLRPGGADRRDGIRHAGGPRRHQRGARRAGRQLHPPLAGRDKRRQAHDHTLRHAGPEGC